MICPHFNFILNLHQVKYYLLYDKKRNSWKIAHNIHVFMLSTVLVPSFYWYTSFTLQNTCGVPWLKMGSCRNVELNCSIKVNETLLLKFVNKYKCKHFVTIKKCKCEYFAWCHGMYEHFVTMNKCKCEHFVTIKKCKCEHFLTIKKCKCAHFVIMNNHDVRGMMSRYVWTFCNNEQM